MDSDDTSVAVLEANDPNDFPETHGGRLDHHAKIHFHSKVTANNAAYAGIHPLVAIESHQKNLAALVQNAIQHLPSYQRAPDFISVTRGPGMRSCLATGLDTAKGLAVSWQIPLLAVNHMQAHALTPRLVHALETPNAALRTQAKSAEKATLPLSPIAELQPPFPFLSLLVSGGHTLLLHSKALCDHSFLASTSDIAIGDAIDKMAREILPSHLIVSSGSVSYGPALERFAFPACGGSIDYQYTVPGSRGAELEKRESQWGWSLPIPLAGARLGRQKRPMDFSFSGLDSAVRQICESRASKMSDEERRGLAREGMRVAFEHLATRLIWALQDLPPQQTGRDITALVLSGGVASNAFLRHVLQAYLEHRGFSHVRVICPPVALCTDNAAMIAWAGIEMWRAGWASDLGVRGLRRWSLDPRHEDGGILGAEGWIKRVK